MIAVNGWLCDIVYLMRKQTKERKSEFLSVRVPSSAKNALDKIAQDNERSLSWIVGKILEDYLARDKADKL